MTFLPSKAPVTKEVEPPALAAVARRRIDPRDTKTVDEMLKSRLKNGN